MRTQSDLASGPELTLHPYTEYQCLRRGQSCLADGEGGLVLHFRRVGNMGRISMMSTSTTPPAMTIPAQGTDNITGRHSGLMIEEVHLMSTMYPGSVLNMDSLCGWCESLCSSFPGMHHRQRQRRHGINSGRDFPWNRTSSRAVNDNEVGPSVVVEQKPPRPSGIALLLPKTFGYSNW